MRSDRIIPGDPKMIDNGDFYIIYKHLRDIETEKEKAVKVEDVIASPKSVRIVNKVIVFFILLGAAYFGILVLIGVIR